MNVDRVMTVVVGAIALLLLTAVIWLYQGVPL